MQYALPMQPFALLKIILPKSVIAPQLTDCRRRVLGVAASDVAVVSGSLLTKVLNSVNASASQCIQGSDPQKQSTTCTRRAQLSGDIHVHAPAVVSYGRMLA